MYSPAEIPSNLYFTDQGSFTLSDEASIRYGRLRDENRRCAFDYQLANVYGIALASLGVPFLFFNFSRKYSLIYIGLCFVWTIWFHNYAWNKWTNVTNKMRNFPNDNKF